MVEVVLDQEWLFLDLNFPEACTLLLDHPENIFHGLVGLAVHLCPLVNILCNQCTRWLGRGAAGYRYQEAFAAIIRIGGLYPNHLGEFFFLFVNIIVSQLNIIVKNIWRGKSLLINIKHYC